MTRSSGEPRSRRRTPGASARTIPTSTLAGVIFCLFPAIAAVLAWVWAGMVAVTIAQRITFAHRALPGA